MEYREVTSRWPPMNFHPRINRGMLMTSTNIPMGMAGIKALTTWPTPVMPP